MALRTTDGRYGPYRGRPVLNPTLFDLLRLHFGEVQISKEGESTTFGLPTLNSRCDGMESRIIEPGEYYRINCPYCGDTRHRLYVNHRWCTEDPVSGRKMRHLAVCYNDDCLKSNYRDFEERVLEPLDPQMREAIKRLRHAPPVVAAADGPLQEVYLPGGFEPLTALPGKHPAIRYLEGRGFDIDELVALWKVGFCVKSTTHVTASRRIIAPITFRGKLVGWQGRLPGEPCPSTGDVPKYFTRPGFAKNRVLYNFDMVQGHRIMVVCEGVTDVWAVGSQAVALLGKTVSSAQKELVGSWAGRTGGLVVLLLDPDAWKSGSDPKPGSSAPRHRELLHDLRSACGGRLVEVMLRGESDPAELGREKVWRKIRKSAKEAGFPIESFR
jgi:hypothetical protein